ncbi:hypothetical protein N0V93_005658 [Gnomoniopsis smithogilvyi]|uniref:C2H2-type domain-containing protein n=1 Tax=Gnomoniopsis smithogilvyi TaxID=1191159 RepID=A0A9W8YX02_9PEZI|nr:hypothetical protein N0V93_005658 [Gnomoniopsis smithogilvyi]
MRFSNAGHLREHYRKHVKPVLCPQLGCRVRTAKQRDMRKHMETHGNHRTFICETCLETFTRSYNLDRHLLNQHGITRA